MLAVGVRAEPQNVAMLSDRELVDLARQGAAGAFREIMRRNNRRLFRAARGVVRDDAEAEDVVQAAYVRAFQGLAGFRGEAGLSTWLTRIAYNEALGRVRCRRTAVPLEHIDGAALADGARILIFPVAHHDGGANPENAAARRELRALLEAAVDALPERFRAVLMARDVDGMSVEETADVLGVRPETVRTRLHRARRLLRAALEERLGDVLRGAFPFDGLRCERLTDAVMAQLDASVVAETSTGQKEVASGLLRQEHHDAASDIVPGCPDCPA
jgi:RNA polymerase sigma-70 factor (ECF subfamily)